MKIKSFIIKGNSSAELPISCDYSYASSQSKLVIFCHGFKGFKDWGCWNLVAKHFVNEGFNFLKFNFSHNGTTLIKPMEITDLKSFSENNYSIEVQDVDRVVKYLSTPENDFIFDELFMIGHSRGGGIACLASQKNNISKLITWAGVADFGERFPENDELLLWKENKVRYILNSRTGEKYPQKYQFYENFVMNKDVLNISNALKEYKGNLLVCFAILDQVLPQEYAQRMSSQVKGSIIKSIRTNHTFGSKHPWNKDFLPTALLELCNQTISFLND